MNDIFLPMNLINQGHILINLLITRTVGVKNVCKKRASLYTLFWHKVCVNVGCVFFSHPVSVGEGVWGLRAVGKIWEEVGWQWIMQFRNTFLICYCTQVIIIIAVREKKKEERKRLKFFSHVQKWSAIYNNKKKKEGWGSGVQGTGWGGGWGGRKNEMSRMWEWKSNCFCG